MFGLMLRSTHKDEMQAAMKTDAARHEIDLTNLRKLLARTQDEIGRANAVARAKGRLAAELLAERDAARAELAALKAQLAHPMAARPRDAKGHFLKVNGSAPATS